MYINAVANSVILYLWHDFYNIIFKIKHKSYIASESAPPPANKELWVRFCQLTQHWLGSRYSSTAADSWGRYNRLPVPTTFALRTDHYHKVWDLNWTDWKEFDFHRTIIRLRRLHVHSLHTIAVTITLKPLKYSFYSQMFMLHAQQLCRRSCRSLTAFKTCHLQQIYRRDVFVAGVQ
jgi:hypothetical protein